MPGMGRREFVALVGGATAAWPLAAGAEQSIPVIGILGMPAPPYAENVSAIRRGLNEAGFVEGRNSARAGAHAARRLNVHDPRRTGFPGPHHGARAGAAGGGLGVGQ